LADAVIPVPHEALRDRCFAACKLLSSGNHETFDNAMNSHQKTHGFELAGVYMSPTAQLLFDRIKIQIEIPLSQNTGRGN
jgi:hypothetical protein